MLLSLLDYSALVLHLPRCCVDPVIGLLPLKIQPTLKSSAGLGNGISNKEVK